ncbi:hypothetical protein MON38_09570 [Hymenobacter sp. DH14]|uniref:DUF3298 domain-containing protein n=1 Tax=Hymenobacter cyanobacteriorum TaxID=2926463 RepID=A0A9X1VEG6_9BACT|nr:hypothetical protein [Hymenobacter cyanobacteriorum]MCI1187669.1 hypothetical protein [Hymenobacter cyanobacteriorum]
MTTLFFPALGLYWLLVLPHAAPPGPTPADTVLPPNRLEHYLDAPTRRWRGRVGQHPVTVFLDSLWRGEYRGKYYYDRRGLDITLSTEQAKAPPGLTLGERDAAYQRSANFLLGPTISPALAGTWRSADGRRNLPVLLRENYADGVRYQAEHWNLTRFVAPDSANGVAGDSAMFQGSYLRITFPQNPAAARRIERMLAPPTAPPQMAFYLDTLLRNRQREQPDYSFIGDKYVVYNSNYLFSVVQFERFGVADYHEWAQSYTFDMRTGKRLGLADLLVAGYQAKLRQLLLQHLRLLWQSNPNYGDVGSSGKLPTGGFVVTGTGLNFSYDDRDDDSLAYPGPYHADRTIDIEIPYEALLPIINLTGPLAPVLRERSLLPQKKQAVLSFHK